MSMHKSAKKQFGAVHSNGDFMSIETFSSAVSYAFDPQGRVHLLTWDAPDEAIGLALLDCLSFSRYLPYEENRAFYDDIGARKRQRDEWSKVLMEKFEFRSRRALYSGTDLCTVESYDGEIHLMPHCHVKSEVWVRRKSDEFEDVVVRSSSSPSEIGKAVRLAISRCSTE